MARRASSNLHPGLIIGIVVAAVVLFIVGKSLMGEKPQSFSNLSRIDMDEYKRGSSSYRNTEELIEGTVNEKLRITDQGQIISVKVDGEAGGLIAIEIPASLKSTNIQREKRYAFRVQYGKGGLAVAKAVNHL